MAYELPPLRFGYNAFEPYLDAETMEPSAATSGSTRTT